MRVVYRRGAPRACWTCLLTIWPLFSRSTGLNPRSICEGFMARHTGPVLVDTNAILESFRVGAWRALAGGYGVETVEECITETQTGYQRRQPEQQIDGAALRASLASVHTVGDPELAK